jgi:hypothetical protein
METMSVLLCRYVWVTNLLTHSMDQNPWKASVPSAGQEITLQVHYIINKGLFLDI